MASKPSPTPRIIERGVLCFLIGVAVLVGPQFMRSEGYREMVAGAHVVGWFAVVLGLALVVLGLVQRARRKSN
ncbi:hypothetical protein BH10PSE18_BH10PSE18_06450 [soil metagenome]|jgi:Na+/proline symporter